MTEHRRLGIKGRVLRTEGLRTEGLRTEGLRTEDLKNPQRSEIKLFLAKKSNFNLNFQLEHIRFQSEFNPVSQDSLWLHNLSHQVAN